MVRGLSVKEIMKRMQKRKFVYLIHIGVVAFLADLAWGIIFSTFSLYATMLRASVALVGVAVSSIGLSRILVSVPLGTISDRVGRRTVIIAGLTAFFLGSSLLVAVSDALQLIPAAMLIGVGVSAVFPIGFTYVADFAHPKRKGMAISIYATFMGTGFSIGPAIGGFISQIWGYSLTYSASSLFFLVSLVIAWKALRRNKPKSQLSTFPALKDFLVYLFGLMKKKKTVVVSFTMSSYVICFSTIFGFLPIYAEKLGLKLTLIGFLLAVRTFFSTVSRLPIGFLIKKMKATSLMILSIVPSSLVLCMIPLLDSYYALLIVLSVEGICFGTFLVSSNTLIAELYGKHERGVAMGLFETSQCAGLTIGPLILGIVGEVWGLNAVFIVAFVIVLLAAFFLGATKKLVDTAKVT